MMSNFFKIILKNKEVGDSERLENLQEQYHAFREERDKDKVSTEKIEEAFETFKEKRDTVHEFEVELAENQIEKLVDEGIISKCLLVLSRVVSFSFPIIN